MQICFTFPFFGRGVPLGIGELNVDAGLRLGLDLATAQGSGPRTVLVHSDQSSNGYQFPTSIRSLSAPCLDFAS